MWYIIKYRFKRTDFLKNCWELIWLFSFQVLKILASLQFNSFLIRMQQVNFCQNFIGNKFHVFVKKWSESFFKYFHRVQHELKNSLHHPTTVARVELCSLTLSGSQSLSLWTLRRDFLVLKSGLGTSEGCDCYFRWTSLHHLLLPSFAFNMKVKKRKLFESILVGCSSYFQYFFKPLRSKLFSLPFASC